MALQHLRSSTANKRPTPASMADGQLALNSADASPGLFFKNSGGALVKIGPVHVGTTAPNATPATGGQAGNSTGELWLDTSLTPNELKTWNGTAWVSATGQEIPVSKLINGSARQLLQTDAAGTDVEWTSNIDVPGTFDVTGAATFDSSVAVSGTLTKSGNNVVTVGDTGTVTSTMIADGTIVDGDVNASAAIAGTKIDPDFGSQDITTTGTSTAASFIPTSSSVPANGVYLPSANNVAISTASTGRLFVDASGKVGIGTSSPSQLLHLGASSALQILLERTGAAPSTAAIKNEGQLLVLSQNTDGISFNTGTTPSERARIDSSGRLLVGTSSSFTGDKFQTNDSISVGNFTNASGGGSLKFVKSRSATIGSYSIVSDGDDLGLIRWYGDDGTDTSSLAAQIYAEVDGTPGANDMPGRLVFSTTADGASSPTERMRISQDGTVEFKNGIKETVYTLATTGTIALDPANGSIQSSVLTGAPTFTDSLASGQTIVLHLEGGATYTVTWPTITWVTGSGNAAPTLTAKDTLVLWKISTTLYGAYVGSYV